MRSKYILFALALTGALASCSDDDNKGTANYKNPYSNPLTDTAQLTLQSGKRMTIHSMYMPPIHL